jgi:hypothetical protein
LQAHDTIPEKITAGVDFAWCVNLLAYPAPTWALQVLLRGPGVIDMASVPDGFKHTLAVPADTTKGWTAGTYLYSTRAVSSGTVIEVDAGQVEIERDLGAITGAVDLRNHVQKVLDSIEAVIEGRATKDQERYRIQDRELYRTPIADLIKLRNTYRAELARIKAAERGGNSLFGRTIRTRL